MTRQRVALLIGIFLLLAFGVGAGWQFTHARAARAETEAARQQIAELERERSVRRAEAALAAATIAAQLGSFERGRAFASEFFTMLQEDADSVPALATEQVQQLLSRRDVTITALSRGEPGIATELARMFVLFRAATGGDAGIIELTPTTAPDSNTTD
jgi:hypothetical protein